MLSYLHLADTYLCMNVLYATQNIFCRRNSAQKRLDKLLDSCLCVYAYIMYVD